MRLVAIGLLAGFFGALFGVGGGIVIVPLLIMAAGFAPRAAAATSLAAIGITALAGTIGYGIAGEVHLWYGLLVGLPAGAGAIAGTVVQQRLTSRSLALSFSALLVGIGVWMLVG